MTQIITPALVARDAAQSRSRGAFLGNIFQIEQPDLDESTFFVRIYEERPSAPKWHGPRVETPGMVYLRARYPIKGDTTPEDAEAAFEVTKTSININPATPTYGVMISYTDTGYAELTTSLESQRSWSLTELIKMLPGTCKVEDFLDLLKPADTYSYREALHFVHRAKVRGYWVGRR